LNETFASVPLLKVIPLIVFVSEGEYLTIPPTARIPLHPDDGAK
jgi:hypothetical protein